MKNKIRFYIGLIASGFLASSALAQFSLTDGGTNNISNGTLRWHLRSTSSISWPPQRSASR